MKLGMMEQITIFAVGVLGGEDNYNLVPRKELTIEAANVLVHHGQQQDNFNSFKSSLSRAVTSLCEKGLTVRIGQQHMQAWEKGLWK